VNPRRVVEEAPHSIEAQLLRAGRAIQPPLSAYQKTFAGLGGGAAALGGAKLASAVTAKSAFGNLLLGTAIKGIAIGVVAGATLLGLVQVTTGRVTSSRQSNAATRVTTASETRAKTVHAVTGSKPVTQSDKSQVLTVQPAVEQVDGTTEPSRSANHVPVSNIASSDVLPVTPRSLAQPQGSLGEEVAALDQIRQALDSGQAQRALDLLERHSQQFSAPRLAEEAHFFRVKALERLGRHAEAEEANAQFRRNFPNSVLPEPR